MQCNVHPILTPAQPGCDGSWKAGVAPVGGTGGGSSSCEAEEERGTYSTGADTRNTQTHVSTTWLTAMCISQESKCSHFAKLWATTCQKGGRVVERKRQSETHMMSKFVSPPGRLSQSKLKASMLRNDEAHTHPLRFVLEHNKLCWHINYFYTGTFGEKIIF